MIHIDFETRSRTNIYDVGAWIYSRHLSTEILCIAWAKDDEEVQYVTLDDIDVGTCDELKAHAASGELFCAHNAFFESCIWENILVARYGWPKLPINRWRCTMAKALARALPRSLEECAEALGTPVQKDKAGKKIMLKLCKPNAQGTWNEDPEDLNALYAYCCTDVETERAIDKALLDLIPSEQNIWFLDQLINKRGIYVDREAVKRAIEFVEIHTERLNELVASVSEGKLDGVSRRMAVLNWCQSQGVDIKGYTKRDVTDTLSQDLPEEVRTVLEAKLSLGRTSVTKYQTLAQSTDTDGRLRDLFIYHGATTGRWTGKLVQLHNLPKGNEKDTDTAIQLMKQSSYEEFSAFYPDVMSTLSSCIRGMLIAAPGHKFYVADYSAIEARVVMWLADEQKGIRQFRDFDTGVGEEPYILMAELIFGMTNIGKKSKERFLGKTTILGSGFGMGAPKFQGTCHNWGQDIEISLATKAIGTYRSTYPRVVSLWHTQEAAAIRAVEFKENVQCGKVRWEYHDRVLLCRLPSGRGIAYNEPTLEYVMTPWGEKKLALHFMSVDAKTKRWKREHTYGGKIVENITQAVARDILAAAMFRCEKARYKIAFSVHDEIVSEVRADFGSLKEFEGHLCRLPVWGEGCPIAAKGFETTRYRKE